MPLWHLATLVVGHDFQAGAQSANQRRKCIHGEALLETKRRLAQACVVADGDLRRILIVDDDVTLGRLMREALGVQLAAEIDATSSPEYGFELALKKRYAVFIFDFSMPMIDGAMLFTLISKVYNHVNPPSRVPPLILISGKGDETRARELLQESGVFGFVAKPFPMNRLIEKVTAAAPEILPR